MIRFGFGAGVGAIVMYWYLTGQIPWREEVERWFSRAATSYSAAEHTTEANQLLADSERRTTTRAR